MVIDNPDICRSCLTPLKDDTPAIIDAHAVIAFVAAFQRLESVAGRRLQVTKAGCIVEHIQLAPGHTGNGLPSDGFAYLPGDEELFCR